MHFIGSSTPSPVPPSRRLRHARIHCHRVYVLIFFNRFLPVAVSMNRSFSLSVLRLFLLPRCQRRRMNGSTKRFAAVFENGNLQVWDYRYNAQPEIKISAHNKTVSALVCMCVCLFVCLCLCFSTFVCVIVVLFCFIQVYY